MTPPNVFVTVQKYPTKMRLDEIRRVIEISDKIDVETLKTLKKLSVFWEQSIAINQVCHKYQWVDIYMLFISVVWPTNHFTVLVCKQLSNLSSSCIIYCF